MFKCSICKNRITSEYGTCSNCNKYLNKGGIVYVTGGKFQKYTISGIPICMICGKAFNQVLVHSHKAHGITADRYKEMFKLRAGVRKYSKTNISDCNKEAMRQRMLHARHHKNYKPPVQKKGGKLNITEAERERRRQQGRLANKAYVLKYCVNNKKENE